MAKRSINKGRAKLVLACAVSVIALAAPTDQVQAAAGVAGCAPLFESLAWSHGAELASGNSVDPQGAARGYQRWRAWALASRSWSLSTLEPGLEDLAIGALAPSPEGHPAGTSSCEALAWRLQNRGPWDPEFMIPHMQRAIDELALIDRSLADAEAARLVRQEQGRADRRIQAGLPPR